MDWWVKIRVRTIGLPTEPGLIGRKRIRSSIFNQPINIIYVSIGGDIGILFRGDPSVIMSGRRFRGNQGLSVNALSGVFALGGLSDREIKVEL